MKASNRWNFRSIIGKVVSGLALAAMFLSMGVAPASADEHGRGGYRDDRRFEHREREHRERYRRHHEGRRVYRSYGYVEPVYVPPPVYYAPAPAPGVSIFLPTIHIR